LRANKSLDVQNLFVLVPTVCYRSKFVDGDATIYCGDTEELKRVNKENTCKIFVNRIGSSLQPRFGSFYFCLYGIKKWFVSPWILFIGVDGCHLKTAGTTTQRFLNGSRRQGLKHNVF
jgi:hypothetical protein